MSELAELISEAIDATSNHVELIDRIIAESNAYSAFEAIRDAAACALACLEPISELGYLPQGGESTGNWMNVMDAEKKLRAALKGADEQSPKGEQQAREAWNTRAGDVSSLQATPDRKIVARNQNSDLKLRKEIGEALWEYGHSTGDTIAAIERIFVAENVSSLQAESKILTAELAAAHDALEAQGNLIRDVQVENEALKAEMLQMSARATVAKLEAQLKECIGNDYSSKGGETSHRSQIAYLQYVAKRANVTLVCIECGFKLNGPYVPPGFCTVCQKDGVMVADVVLDAAERMKRACIRAVLDGAEYSDGNGLRDLDSRGLKALAEILEVITLTETEESNETPSREVPNHHQ